jgi:hypothetical protein
MERPTGIYLYRLDFIRGATRPLLVQVSGITRRIFSKRIGGAE